VGVEGGSRVPARRVIPYPGRHGVAG
jgi:hypothetical protein